MKLDIVKGNIVAVAADAIVLPANHTLKEGFGVSTAIFRAAGRNELTKACDNIGYRETGEAVSTPAYQLEAKYIIHTVVPQWIDGNSGEEEFLRSAYVSALKAADEKECETIAFPLLSSGNNGFDTKIAFKIAASEIESFEADKLKGALLVIYDDSAASVVASEGYAFTEASMANSITLQNGQVKASGKKPRKVIAWELYDKIVDYSKEDARTYLGNDENQKKIAKAFLTSAKAAAEKLSLNIIFKI